MRSNTQSLSGSTAGQRNQGACGSTFSTVGGGAASAPGIPVPRTMPARETRASARPSRESERAVNEPLLEKVRAGIERTASHRLASGHMTRIPALPPDPTATLGRTLVLAATLSLPLVLAWRYPAHAGPA